MDWELWKVDVLSAYSLDDPCLEILDCGILRDAGSAGGCHLGSAGRAAAAGRPSQAEAQPGGGPARPVVTAVTWSSWAGPVSCVFRVVIVIVLSSRARPGPGPAVTPASLQDLLQGRRVWLGQSLSPVTVIGLVG